MLKRCSILVLAATSLAGCANENSSVFTGLSPAPANAAGLTSSGLSQDPRQKTLASKMLTAIALERVTGRKPDPSRLAEIY